MARNAAPSGPFRRPALAAALALLAAPSALACSVADDYRVPTNLELASRAQAVFVGRVEGETKAERLTDNVLRVQVLSVLKGDLAPGPLPLPELALAEDRFATLSNPYDLRNAHPLAYIGSCIRYMFPEGTTALFFVEQRAGAWSPVALPFSRWAEDVPGLDAPWVRLAATYVRAVALPEAERAPFLTAERDRLRALPADPVARLMAADIDRQLAGPNPPWNAVMEERLGLPRGEPEPDPAAPKEGAT